MIISSEDAEKEVLLCAAKLMVAAARTAPKTGALILMCINTRVGQSVSRRARYLKSQLVGQKLCLGD